MKNLIIIQKFAPVIAADRSGHEKFTVSEITKSCFEPGCQMVSTLLIY